MTTHDNAKTAILNPDSEKYLTNYTYKVESIYINKLKYHGDP